MSALREAMSHAVLGWVKPELDLTLRLVRGEIESFADNPTDALHMQVCVGYLHQVQGTLHMIELCAPAMVAEELEKLAQALHDGQVADADEACATLMRGTVLLPDYLERLQSGHRDIPIVLLPLLNDIRAARGQAGLSESVLFAPDLERPLPKNVPSTEPLLSGSRESRMEQAYEQLERVLDSWSEHGALAEPEALVSTLASLQRLAESTTMRRMLWVAVNVAEALRDGVFAPSPTLQQGFGGVLRALRQTRQAVSPGVVPGQEATRQLLYLVAHSSAMHPALEDLRAVFDLQATSPSAAEIEHARGSVSGRNRTLLDTVGGALKEELMRIKDALDLQLRTKTGIAALAPQVMQLDSVADTLGMLGLGFARSLVLQQRDVLAELVDGRRIPDEGALLDIAGALLSVDASLDDQATHLGEAAPARAATASRRTVEVLAGEAIHNFAQARQQFVAFIETGWEHAQLEAMPRLLDEVGGALRMLELTAPADYVDAVGRYIDIELIQRRRIPAGAQLDTLADAMASLEYFLEALREHRPNREQILDITRSSLESLGYWRLPSQQGHAPASQSVALSAPAELRSGSAAEIILDSSGANISQNLMPERDPDLPAFFPSGVAACAFDPVAGEFDGPTETARDESAFEPAASQAMAVEDAFAGPTEWGQASGVDQTYPASIAPEGTGTSSIVTPFHQADVGNVEHGPGATTEHVRDGAALYSGFDFSGSDIDDEIREVFLQEFAEEIAHLHQRLPAWSANLESLDQLRPIRRVFHTLKGSGRLVGARQLGEFAWKIENMLNRVLDRSRPPTIAVVALLEQASATLPKLEAALRGERDVHADLAGIEAVADRIAAGDETSYGAPPPMTATVAAAPVIEQPTAAAPVLDGTPASVDSVLREILEAEITHHLQAVDTWLEQALSVRTGAANDALLRAFHTMHGAFAMSDVPEITEITGRAEQYIKHLLSNGVQAEAAGVASLNAAAQAIRTTMSALQSTQPQIPLFAGLRVQLDALREALPQLARPFSTLVDDRLHATYADQGSQITAKPPALRPSDASDPTGAVDWSHEPEVLAAQALTPDQDSALIGTETEFDVHAESVAPAEAAVGPVDDAQAGWFAPALEHPLESRWADAPAAIRADAQHALGQLAGLDPVIGGLNEAGSVARIAHQPEALSEYNASGTGETLFAAALAISGSSAVMADLGDTSAEHADAHAHARSVPGSAMRGHTSNPDASALLLADNGAAPQPESVAADMNEARTEQALAEAVMPVTTEGQISSVEAEAPIIESPQEISATNAALAGAGLGQVATPGDKNLVAMPEPSPASDLAEQALDFQVLDRELIDLFAEEGNDLLDHSDALLARLHDVPNDRGPITGLQRDLHTIKGGARMAGIGPVGDLAHAIESLLEQIAEHRAEVDRDVLGLLERGFDVLHAMLMQTGAHSLATQRPDLIAEFDARARGECLGVAAAGGPLRGLAADLAIAHALVNVAEFDPNLESDAVAPPGAEPPAMGFNVQAASSVEDVHALGSGHGLGASAPVDPVEAQASPSLPRQAQDVAESTEPSQPSASKPVPGDGQTPGAGSRWPAELDQLVGGVGKPTDIAAPALALPGQETTSSAHSAASADSPAAFATDAAWPTESVPLPAASVPAPMLVSTGPGEAPSSQPIAAQAALSAPIELQPASEDDSLLLGPGQEQVRVRADLLDRLVNHAGEVAIYRARLEQQMGAFRAVMAELDRTSTRLHDQLRRLDLETEAQIVARYQREQDNRDTAFDPLELDRFSTLQQLSRALGESAADISGLQGVLDDLARQNDLLLGQQSRVSSELQEGLLRTRMLPFESSVPRLRRVLRQAAADTGKQVQLELQGAHGELDRNVLARMTAPLEHLLRNAVAHGLEDARGRRIAGKPEDGLVRVVLRREGTEMVLQVSDDGAGINHEAIRRRAEQRGMVQPGVQLSDSELEQLILQPGFSTYEEVSQLAGRGVGMDVVHNEVRQLGGALEIHSIRGQGTTFTLRLPQTLAVTQAVFVRVGESQFAVPVAAVSGIGRISRERFDTANAVYLYGGEEYALHDLGTLVGQAAAKAENLPQVPLLLVRAGDLRAAVAVDQVLGNREIVVKPVGPQVSSIPGIYGATITGDGSVVVILDAAPLIRRYLSQPALTPATAAPAQQRHVPLVMVVDDSLTMRKVTSRVLERHNFEVISARDGVEALERLEDRVPDLMLLDIEMPRMDGYELAAAMKAQPRFAGVPIVMITSRTGEKHRQRALAIGVQRYLGKPYQELDLMRNVYDLLGIARVRD